VIAYFDESGSDQGAPVFGLACFVARERHWQKFNARWSRLLDQQSIPDIHMADLQARQGYFKGWSHEKYELLCDTIGIILSRLPLWGFYNAFVMAHYDEVIHRPEKRRRYYWAGTPYLVSLQAILEMMAEPRSSSNFPLDPARAAARLSASIRRFPQWTRWLVAS